MRDAPLRERSAPVLAGDASLDTTGPRVLVAMGGIPLYGQERGNIQVFHALQDAGVNALFVTHGTYGHERVEPELDRLGLPWTRGTYPGFWSLRNSPADWVRRVRELRAGVAEFMWAARSYGPTHIHMMNERYLLNLLPAVWRIGLPVIFRLGDLPRQHNALYRFLWSRLLIPSVDEFVCISEFVRSKLLKAGAPAERTRVIRNVPPDRGGGASDLPADLQAERTGAAAPYGGQTVAYAGQLTAEKGVDVLTEAALRLCRSRSDVRFLIAGDYAWQNPFAEALRSRVEAAGLADRVRFLGFREDVVGLLRLADVHVAPSVWAEPLGNVVQEAKRESVPSVVFKSGGLPELVLESGVDGVVCRAPTADALVDGIVHYLDMSPGRRAAAGTAARTSLRALGLTHEQFVTAWLRVFTGEPPRSPRSA